MPIYELSEEILFPRTEWAEPNGLLAVGGDLRPERILHAYELGIFPWYSPPDPILWWAPDPRFVLYPGQLKVAKSMKQVFRKGHFRLSVDHAFPEVIRACQRVKRKGQRGTWITDDMEVAYIRLHELGYAHSVEVWQEDELVGGLYGLSMGKAFFGESMFSHKSNASKAGFIRFVQALEARGFQLIDCQVYTAHLESLGATSIPRKQFARELKRALNAPSSIGPWKDWQLG